MNTKSFPEQCWIKPCLFLFLLCLAACGSSPERSPNSQQPPQQSSTKTINASASETASSNETTQSQASAPSSESETLPETDRPYINSLLPEARRIQEEYGIPIDTTVAIAIQETGWGKSEIGQNNHFGLRCASDDCITLNGISYETCPDEAECFNMFANSINKLSNGDPSDLRVIYKNGYATSPRWTRRVRRIRRQVRKTLKESGISSL